MIPVFSPSLHFFLSLPPSFGLFPILTCLLLVLSFFFLSSSLRSSHFPRLFLYPFFLFLHLLLCREQMHCLWSFLFFSHTHFIPMKDEGRRVTETLGLAPFVLSSDSLSGPLSLSLLCIFHQSFIVPFQLREDQEFAFDTITLLFPRIKHLSFYTKFCSSFPSSFSLLSFQETHNRSIHDSRSLQCH